MALKNFTQFTPYTVLSATDNFVGYRGLDEFRSDLSSVTDAISGLLLVKGFTPGASIGVVKKVNFRYTITTNSPKNAVSGTDDFGLNLSYTPTQVETYRNGAYLVNSLDFQANNGTQITNLSTLNVGDIVEVVALSSTLINLFQAASATGDITGTSFRYTVAPGNTIQPGNSIISGLDDFGATLNFTSPNFDVFLNGSHLVRDLDYGSYSGGSSITLNDVVASGDTVDVVSLLANNILQIAPISGYAGIQRIQAGKDFYISNVTGTGSVSLSAKPGLRDIKVPDWTTGGHVTNWSTLQLYLSSVASSNRFTQASASYIENYGTFSGTNDYAGGVLAANGNIYFVPHNSIVGRIVNPNTNTIITYGTFPGSAAYTGGVLASNGKIYFVPANATAGAIVDPSSSGGTSVQFYGSFPGGNAYYGGVLAPNGKIYFAPTTATAGAIVDPNTNNGISVQFYGSFPGASAYVGGVVAPNGKIYFVPTNATAGAIVDPSSSGGTSVQFYGSFPGSGAYHTGVLSPNGKIYFIPFSATAGAIVDPNTNNGTSVEFYGSFPGSSAYLGGILAPNGGIYLTPYNANVGRIVNTNNNNVITYGSFPGTGAYVGGILSFNQKIYFVPHTATSGRTVTTLNNNNWNINVCTNPMFNKY